MGDSVNFSFVFDTRTHLRAVAGLRGLREMTEQREHRHMSMFRSYTPADLLTLANASCGTLSVFACLSYIEDERSPQMWSAFVLPIVALMFDVADGYVARLDARRQSRLGADLDSLAD